MFYHLKKILSLTTAKYADIRYEILKETKIVFNGRELIHVGTNSSDGFVIRVLKNGGLSSIAFTKLDDASKALKFAEENACLLSINSKKPVEFAKTEIFKDKFSPVLNEDPRNITIDEKLDLLRKYNNIPLNYEKVITTNIYYNEVIREKFFLSTEGAEIKEDLITTSVGGLITAREGSLIQNIRVSAGGSTGFSVLRNRESEFENRTKILLELLRAEQANGGIYDVLINQDLAGVFTHEAFGHFSEADLIEDSPSMREKMRIGALLGTEILNIKDDPTISGQLGFYKYDDEGVSVRPVSLMRNGVLSGRLHSRRTAAAFNEDITGHCVAEDYRFAPIVRMGNIFIEPGDKKFEEMLDTLGNGLYLLDAKGGQTSGENFTFGAQYGYIIKGGKKSKMI